MASIIGQRPTVRDREVLVALDRCPLTATQIVKLSQTFVEPFNTEKLVRRRMLRLAAASWVRSWRYATTSGGSAPQYYKLTLPGYRVLYGDDAQAPTRRYFAEVSISLQYHTHRLADFIVHTLVGARQAGVQVSSFAGDGRAALQVDGETLRPDASFGLANGVGQFHYLVELDNSTETIRSAKDVESWQRKIRIYDQYQNRCEHRFRVLVATTQSEDRMRRILQAAGELTSNPDRRLFYGVHLPDYLGEGDPLRSFCFTNHQGDGVSLLPAVTREVPATTANLDHLAVAPRTLVA